MNTIPLNNPRKIQITRRDAVRHTVSGVGLTLMTGICGTTWSAETEVEDSNQKDPTFDVAGREAQIVEEAYRLGRQYEEKYGGCAQCTLAALQDAIPFLPKDRAFFRGACALDGGSTPNGLQNCGSFTGAGMAIGYLCGRQRNGTFEGSSEQSHKLIRKLYKHFEEHYGSVLCKDVREKSEHRCPEVVGLSAKWTAQILLDEFGIHATEKADTAPIPESEKKEEG